MQKDGTKNFRKNSRNGRYFEKTYGAKYEIGKGYRSVFKSNI